MKKLINQFIVNSTVLIFGISTLFSGLLIQLKFHIGQHGDISSSEKFLGITYAGWTEMHKISVVVLVAFIIYHFALHWKWFQTVVCKRLFKRHRQVVTLSITFLIATFSGFFPWLIYLGNGDEVLRKEIIEIHDKVGIVLSVLLIMHMMKRQQWFFKSLEKVIK